MRFAVNIPPFTDAGTVVDLAVEAEAAGWDGVFLWDHLQWDRAEGREVLDPWVLLGAIAHATQRVVLGTLVTPLARRRPWMVAKHIATLDQLSGGRAVLGVGLGVPEDADFRAFGDEMDPRERAVRLDDGLAVVDALLRGGPVEHDGPRFGVSADLHATPVQRPRPPIWVAGVAPNPKPLSRAVKWDGIVPIGRPHLTPDGLAAYVGDVARPGWDVVAPGAPGVPADEYADAGATWLIDSTRPFDDWVPEFRARITAGPH